MFKKLSYIFLCCATALLSMSCEKNALTLPEEPVLGGARIKLIHAAPDAPGVDLYINNTKISGFTPLNASSISSGTPVPIAYNNTFPNTTSNYAVVKAGQAAVTLSAPASTTASSATVVSNQTLTLEDGKYYSLFVAGTGTQPEVLLVNDDFGTATDPSKFYVRFINLAIGVNYDLALVSGQVLAQNVGYKGISPFVAVDVANSAAFAFRLPGTTTNIGTLTFSSNFAGRVLTVFTRGVPGRTGTQAPGINVYTNR